MKKIPGIILVMAMCSSGALAMTGREVMAKNDALPEAASMRQSNVLAIFKGGGTEKKEFSGTMKKFGERTRKRMTFQYPTRLEFLVWDEPGRDSMQWIKLSSGKVRKIASSDKASPWVNSHFYNEDISSYDIDDFDYTLTGESDVNGVACYVVESVKKSGEQVYTKRVVYVAKDTWVVQRVDFYEKGRHTKTLTFEKIEKIQGIYTPRKAVMERTDGKGKSILYIRSVEYDIPLPDQSFNLESF